MIPRHITGDSFIGSKPTSSATSFKGMHAFVSERSFHDLKEEKHGGISNATDDTGVNLEGGIMSVMQKWGTGVGGKNGNGNMEEERGSGHGRKG